MIQRIRDADPRLVTILLIVFVQFVGASMALPILPLLAKREFALSDAEITPLLASFFAAQFVAGPFIGRLSDTYGRIPVLVISQVGTVLSFILLIVAGSVPLLYASRILDGITGGNIVVAQAYITDIFPREKRTQALGLLFAAFGVGFILGPALGGVLSGFLGPRVPFAVAAVAASVVVVLTWRNLDETLTPERREANKAGGGNNGLSPMQILTNGPLVSVLIIAFIAQFGLGLVQATFALYGDSVIFAGESQRTTDIGIGVLLAMVGVGQLITQIFLLDRALRRFGEAWLIVFGDLIRSVGLLLLGLIVSPYAAGIAILLFALGSGLLIPSLQTMITNTVDDAYRGGALGLFQSVNSLAIIFSTFFGGQIFAYAVELPYYLGGVLGLAVAIPAVFLVRWARKHPDVQMAHEGAEEDQAPAPAD
jgi:MFS transporter, DHA1 family, tetracycline resistance protein